MEKCKLPFEALKWPRFSYFEKFQLWSLNGRMLVIWETDRSTGGRTRRFDFIINGNRTL